MLVIVIEEYKVSPNQTQRLPAKIFFLYNGRTLNFSA